MAASEPRTTVGLILLGVGGLIALVAVGLLTIARGIRRSRAQFATTAVRVPGEVLDVRWEAVHHRDAEISMQARTLLRYAAGGQTLEQWSFETSSPAAGKPGQSLDVLYDPAAPGRVRVADDRVALRAVSGFFTAFASVFLVVGCLIAAGGIAVLAA